MEKIRTRQGVFGVWLKAGILQLGLLAGWPALAQVESERDDAQRAQEFLSLAGAETERTDEKGQIKTMSVPMQPSLEVSLAARYGASSSAGEPRTQTTPFSIVYRPGEARGKELERWQFTLAGDGYAHRRGTGMDSVDGALDLRLDATRAIGGGSSIVLRTLRPSRSALGGTEPEYGLRLVHSVADLAPNHSLTVTLARTHREQNKAEVSNYANLANMLYKKSKLVGNIDFSLFVGGSRRSGAPSRLEASLGISGRANAAGDWTWDLSLVRTARPAPASDTVVFTLLRKLRLPAG